MSWFKPGNIHQKQEQTKGDYKNDQEREERIFRFYLKYGLSNEIIWLDDFSDEDKDGNKLVPFGYFYEHVYQSMMKDHNEEYSIKDGFFAFTTCRKQHDDKKGCPMCDADFSITKSAALTVLASRKSSIGNEYFSRQLYIVKSANWDAIQMILTNTNLQYQRFLVKRKSDKKSVSSGELFSKIGQLTKDDLLAWKEEEQPKLYGSIEPYNYEELFCPITHKEMKNNVESGAFKLIYKQSEKEMANETKHLSMTKDDEKVPF